MKTQPSIPYGFAKLYLLFLVAAVVFGITLVGGFSVKQPKKLQTQQAPGTLVNVPLIGNGKTSLQLQTLRFVTSTPVPTGSPSNDCNNGSIQSPEPYIIFAINPDPGSSVGKGGAIKLWYNDELPLTLGSGTISTPPDIKKGGHIVNPNVGDINVTDPNNPGFPFYPAIFLTDITNNAGDKSGDAQHGGKPNKPDEVWGTWQARNSATNWFVDGNGLNLPTGADPFPQSSNIKVTSDPRGRGREVYNSAEIIWNADNLKDNTNQNLVSGHSYRAQIIVHDGDQSNGDDAEICATVKY